jgi:hypothetical protein
VCEEGIFLVNNNNNKKSFETLKKKVSKQLVLTLLHFSKVFQVDYDASGSTIGAFLSQNGKMIAFFREKLNDAKKKYYIYDHELYAIFQALMKWRYYLLPKEFVLFIDHKALQYINNPGKLNHNHLKWVEFLHGLESLIRFLRHQVVG